MIRSNLVVPNPLSENLVEPWRLELLLTPCSKLNGTSIWDMIQDVKKTDGSKFNLYLEGESTND